MGIVSADFGGRRTRRRVLRWTIVALGLVLVFWLLPLLIQLYTDWLWFRFDVRLPRVFWTVLSTRVGLGAAFGLAFFVLLIGNVEVARRFAPRTTWYEEERELRVRLAEVMEYFASRFLYVALLAVAVVAAYLVGLAASERWNSYLLFRNAVAFDLQDPIFGRDVGFYVFRLPFWRYLWQWWYLSLIAVFLVSAGAHYLDKAIRLLRGIPAFAPHVKAHLSVLLAAILALKAFGYRLDAYHLLYSARGVTFGASYTDVNAQLLAYNVLFVVALAAAVVVLVNMHFRGLWLPLAAIGFLGLASLLLNVAYPALVERFHVVPNQFAREQEYIGHTIAFTRRGFGLERIEPRHMRQLELVDPEAIEANLATIENIRLWDYRPVLDTYQNQQAIWDYYRFDSVDVDRYWINGRYRQVLIAARELDMDRLLRILGKRTWQNEHVFYTHGCGVVMTPVSDVVGSGLPNYVIGDIPPQSTFELEVKRHGIYYGELTNGYVVVGTTEEENDYTLPETNEVAKTRYAGAGGVPIGSPLPRLATAMRFRDINILISTIITEESRVLWNRNVASRARRIAPFLAFDHDPYIVVGSDGGLYWIQDAYTTSGMFPYSEPYQTRTGHFNYVRNSVKVVTDAYEGTVGFYVAEPEDPIIRAYQRIFPDLFRPLDEMPAGLIAHIRYPEALFNTQAARLTEYHMTDPRIFYNKLEKWEIARELPKSAVRGVRYRVGGTETGPGEMMQAYYALLALPGEAEPEYVLMLPFTPEARPNMVAWLAARCDGDNYGRLMLYHFPKVEQVWGPIQIEASIDQHPEISERLSLWSQHGSDVIRGNLLVIPIDSSILYVEPIYLRATQSPFPELKQVVVGRGDGRVAMRPTLSQALSALLGMPAPQLAAVEPDLDQVLPSVRAPAAPAEAAAPPTPATPAPAAHALALEAERHFQEALRHQREGDWVAYGQALERLRETLSRLVAATRG